jgi:hypothetical protein
MRRGVSGERGAVPRNVAATGGSQGELEHEIDQTIEEVRVGRS